MSGPAGAPSPAPRSASIGPNTGGMSVPQQQQPGGGSMTGSAGPGGGGGQQTMSQQNLNQIVIEYLNKKGYSKTEAMLRMESSNLESEGRMPNAPTDAEKVKYPNAFNLLRTWIDDNLEVYKPELRRLLWPVFVYSFLRMIDEGYNDQSRLFFERNKDIFGPERDDDLNLLKPISLPEHIKGSTIAQTYRGSKYVITMSTPTFTNLIQFLEAKGKEGGTTIKNIVHENMNLKSVDRAADDRYSLAAMIARINTDEPDMPAEEEGIPGHTSSSAYATASLGTQVKLKLNAGKMDPDKIEDVRADLADEDAAHPPLPGQTSYGQTFEQMIKVEDEDGTPQLNEVPYPKPTARDVALEVQKIKENRDRFKIEERTGGVGPGVSAMMFTLHNTFDSIACIDFSDDQYLIAAGTQDSVIRVWSIDGKPLKSIVPAEHDRDAGFSSRRLIGHSGAVYGVSFSPGAANNRSSTMDADTRCKWLLSCSADRTIGLWNLDTWTMLVQYKGHNQPVWDVTWGPFGHYFLSGGHDKTARLWSTDKVSCLRIFAGHDNDVDVVCFHPNTAYVFTGSCDKTVRMWSVTTGNSVRMFTGHPGNVTALACSPSGKLLASADDQGTIILWDLAPGRLFKRMRGHTKGGIWSLSWSVESTVLTSAGADGTVRVWDVHGPATDATQGKVVGEGGAGSKIDVGASAGGAASAAATAGATTGGKKKGNVVVTPDQISAFPTKKTPVLKVKFTRMNLIEAGGCYSPNN